MCIFGRNLWIFFASVHSRSVPLESFLGRTHQQYRSRKTIHSFLFISVETRVIWTWKKLKRKISSQRNLRNPPPSPQQCTFRAAAWRVPPPPFLLTSDIPPTAFRCVYVWFELLWIVLEAYSGTGDGNPRVLTRLSLSSPARATPPPSLFLLTFGSG